MSETMSDGNGKGPEVGADEVKSAPAPEHTSPSCNIGFCPICLAVTAMQPLKPEVIEHLMIAGKEFLLAARAVLDARSDQLDGTDASGNGATRLEKIDIG
jgi:hypothetical protein